MPSGSVPRVCMALHPASAGHVGAMRIALFSYLYARKIGGRLILRVDGPEAVGTQAGRAPELCSYLAWLGLTWDEGPDRGGAYGLYRQSARGAHDVQAVQQLLAQGDAYWCESSQGELVGDVAHASTGSPPAREDGPWDQAVVEAARARRARRLDVRFRVHPGETLGFEDLVRRQVTFSSDQVGDFTIYTSHDPLLHEGRADHSLAAAVDDQAMGSTHLLRGEEDLGETCRQILLCRALGYTPPRFGHLGAIRLSAAKQETEGPDHRCLGRCRDEGYLPEALIAYLATMGWLADEEKSAPTLEQLVERFDIRQLSAQPARFDAQRLRAYNRRVLRAAEPHRVQGLYRSSLEGMFGDWESSAGTALDPDSWFRTLATAVQQEAGTVGEMVSLSQFAFVRQVTVFAPEARAALQTAQAHDVLTYCRAGLMDQTPLATPTAAQEYFRGVRHHFRDVAGLRGRQVMPPIRAALTGSLVGPCLGVMASLLGSKRCVERLDEVL